MRAGDPIKAKHLETAPTQFAEDGASKLFKPVFGSGWIVGVVGPLQFDVPASRIELECGLPVRSHGRGSRRDPVYMRRLQWDIDRVARDWPEIRLTGTKDMMI